MSDVNTVVVVGRLVEKPIIKYGASGTAVTNLRIANNTYSKTSESKTKVNFFTVVVFGKQAENCEKYLDKGRQVIINGRLDQNSWEDNNGNKRSTVRVIANSVQFIGGSPAAKDTSIPSQDTVDTNGSDQASDEPAMDATTSDFDSTFESPIDDTDNIPF
ncbi:MAG: single-stranded DNA-binding protein [Spirochaetes bacterium]|nr:single-stranded DNA-binding protein [Spirochaetota bacterium]